MQRLQTYGRIDASKEIDEVLELTRKFREVFIFSLVHRKEICFLDADRTDLQPFGPLKNHSQSVAKFAAAKNQVAMKRC